jgi:phenylacetate-CoA ligase
MQQPNVTFPDEYEKTPFAELQDKCFEEHGPAMFDRALAASGLYKVKYADFASYKSSNLTEFFEELPFTEKGELLQDQLETPPFGKNLCVDNARVSRVHKTSGTTGRPLMLAYTKTDLEHTVVAGARGFRASGLRPHHTVVHCLNFCMWAGGLTDALNLEATGATVIPYGVGNSRELIEMMRFVRPDAIHCTPSYLARLEQILHEDFSMEPVELGLKLGLFGAERGMEDSNFRKSIEQKWGLQAMNANYGMADVLSLFGSECEARNGLHFTGQGILHVEILDPGSGQTLELRPGARGELVLTTLRKEAQPVIRYRTHDMIEVLGTDCTCGRKGFRFKVIGRSDDMFTVKGINVFPSSIARVVNQHLDQLTGEHRILLSASNPIQKMEIEVEVSDGISHEDLAEELTRAFIKTLSFCPSIKLLPQGSLPRTMGKSKRVFRTL